MVVKARDFRRGRGGDEVAREVGWRQRRGEVVVAWRSGLAAFRFEVRRLRWQRKDMAL